MVDIQDKILLDVCSYYSVKFKDYGQSPRGVDWNGEEGQFTRFQQLMNIARDDDDFSLIDWGCGYGALLDYLHVNFQKYNYIGIDISEEMIAGAKERYNQVESAQFYVSDTPPANADYSIASGIFNVRLGNNDNDWWSYMTAYLDLMNQSSKKGFSFNCLTKYSDPEKMRDYLYYTDPCKIFEWCKSRYSKEIALLHDYGLYEFTILVRK